MIDTNNLYFETFSDERDLEPIIKLVEQDLSEPYSIYTYRFFIYEYPKMCIMVQNGFTYIISYIFIVFISM